MTCIIIIVIVIIIIIVAVVIVIDAIVVVIRTATSMISQKRIDRSRDAVVVGVECCRRRCCSYNEPCK